MNYDNTDKGIFGKNKFKEQGDNKPDYKGKGNFNGEDFEVAGWIKTNKTSGEEFFSLSFSKPFKKKGTVNEVPF